MPFFQRGNFIWFQIISVSFLAAIVISRTNSVYFVGVLYLMMFNRKMLARVRIPSPSSYKLMPCHQWWYVSTFFSPVGQYQGILQWLLSLHDGCPKMLSLVLPLTNLIWFLIGQVAFLYHPMVYIGKAIYMFWELPGNLSCGHCMWQELLAKGRKCCLAVHLSIKFVPLVYHARLFEMLLPFMKKWIEISTFPAQ